MNYFLKRLFCIDGGAEENRTPDPLRAKQVLSQLSYGPVKDYMNLKLCVGCTFWFGQSVGKHDYYPLNIQPKVRII